MTSFIPDIGHGHRQAARLLVAIGFVGLAVLLPRVKAADKNYLDDVLYPGDRTDGSDAEPSTLLGEKPKPEYRNVYDDGFEYDEEADYRLTDCNWCLLITMTAATVFVGNVFTMTAATVFVGNAFSHHDAGCHGFWRERFWKQF